MEGWGRSAEIFLWRGSVTSEDYVEGRLAFSRLGGGGALIVFPFIEL